MSKRCEKFLFPFTFPDQARTYFLSPSHSLLHSVITLMANMQFNIHPSICLWTKTELNCSALSEKETKSKNLFGETIKSKRTHLLSNEKILELNWIWVFLWLMLRYVWAEVRLRLSELHDLFWKTKMKKKVKLS